MTEHPASGLEGFERLAVFLNESDHEHLAERYRKAEPSGGVNGAPYSEMPKRRCLLNVRFWRLADYLV